MPAYVLSATPLVARSVNASPAFTTPLRTSSPPCRSTRRDSPVSADSSSIATSRSSRPSTGTISPGRTSSRSPGTTSSSGGEVSVAPSTRCTSRGTRSRRAWRSLRARAVARASSVRPVASITEMTAPARYSPTARAPMRASTAMMSTPTRPSRALDHTHRMAGPRPAMVASAHSVLATAVAPRSWAMPPPTSNPNETARRTAGSRPSSCRVDEAMSPANAHRARARQCQTSPVARRLRSRSFRRDRGPRPLGRPRRGRRSGPTRCRRWTRTAPT